MRGVFRWIGHQAHQLGINRSFLLTLESTIIVLFFIQALRFAIGTYYSRIASASLVSTIMQRVTPEALAQISTQPGYIDPNIVVQETAFLIYILALPLLALLIGRFRFFMIVATILTATARTLMIASSPITAATSAALTIGAGLLFIALSIRQRPHAFAPMFILAFAADQIFRTLGNTLDPTWSPTFLTTQIILSVFVILLGLLNFLINRNPNQKPEHGLMTFWGGIGFGAILFLQLSLLSTANAIARRAEISYVISVPLVTIATLLPLFAPIRVQARQVISLFDSSVRGWVWLLFSSLLIVLGTRFTGTIAGVGFIGAQFAISMLWWWLIRPQAEKERNLSGIWVFLGTLIFALLLMFDVFTYEYAYIRGFAEPLTVLNNTLVPLLRGFRGLGYAVILLAVFISTIPMIQTQKRIAWRSTATTLQSALVFLFIGGMGVLAGYISTPPLVFGANNLTSLRTATYNIHGGYSEFYAVNLETAAQTIEQSGANVVLLQEVEAGRLTSFGVDQSIWLARRLGMDTRFFSTNEGLQGLAVLSNVPIVYDDGEILGSLGQQTGLQRVQVQPNDDTIVTIYNTWLALLLEGDTITEQEREQQQQLNRIIQIISQHHPNGELGRTVFGGTFNNIPDSPLIQSIGNLGFNDPFAGFLIERSATLVRTGLSARIDYLWIYPNLAEGVGVIDTNASDHRLAFVSINLN